MRCSYVKEDVIFKIFSQSTVFSNAEFRANFNLIWAPHLAFVSPFTSRTYTQREIRKSSNFKVQNCRMPLQKIFTSKHAVCSQRKKRKKRVYTRVELLWIPGALPRASALSTRSLRHSFRVNSLFFHANETWIVINGYIERTLIRGNFIAIHFLWSVSDRTHLAVYSRYYLVKNLHLVCTSFD